MKNLFKTTLLIVGLLGVTQTSHADLATRQALASKFQIRYIHQPEPDPAPEIVLDLNAVVNGTESGSFWTQAGITRFHELVRALLRDPANGGDSNLQSYALETVRILDQPVLVYLINDPSGISVEAARRLGASRSSQGYVWASARNYSNWDDLRIEWERCAGRPVSNRLDARFAGQFSMGIHNVTNGQGNAGAAGKRKMLATFLHELMHTQDRTDGRAHIFTVSGSNRNYGVDGVHYYVEAIPNRASTYKEGIANTVSFLYNNAMFEEGFRWFADNGIMYVEKEITPPGTGPGEVGRCSHIGQPSADVWLYNQIQALSPRPQNHFAAERAYAGYRLNDLPVRFLAHNEQIIALVLAEYVRHVGSTKFFRALKANDRTVYRTSTSGLAVLFEQMCAVELPTGQTARSLLNAGVSESGPKKYLLPLAYMDYFTRFRSANQQEFRGLFENMISEEWVNLYWIYRPSLASANLVSSPPVRGDLTNVALALGVTRSEP